MRREALHEVLNLLEDPILFLKKRGACLVCTFANDTAQLYFDPENRLGTTRRETPLDHIFPDENSRSVVQALAEDALAGTPRTDEIPGPFPGVQATVRFRGDKLSNGTIVLRGSVIPGTSERRIPDAMEYQDATTGLMNRHALKVIMDKESSRARRDGEPMACLFVMLHNFKEINQHHGHHVGDLLLENTGVRTREVIRRSDYVFRWEGTNLVVLLPHLATSLDVAIVADKLVEAVTLPYRFRTYDIAPGCHIGVALFPDDADTTEGLINCANSAVIEAERRRIPFLLYDAGMHDRAVERLTIRSGIQRAFERGEFEVYYQPILHPDGRIAGAEALMRWNHAERGLLSPQSFIEIAEESHLITLIDKVAIFSVCRTLADWNRFPDLFISLNISARDLADATLVQVVQQAMSDHNMSDPGRIKLELTESRIVERSTVSQTAVADLQALGIDTWIDDFGTGQSSLTYLKHLPVSTVKIDKDFVRDITTSPDDLAYFRSIIDTIRSRSKQVVLEGIATAEQHRLVKSLPVTYLQGFYFAGPMRAHEFEKLLSSAAVLPLQ